MATIDPISLEIQWQRLVAIADEIDTAVIRTSFSTIVGESHDFGVRGAGLTVKALADDTALPHDDRSHHGVRAGPSPPPKGEFQCPEHVSLPNRLFHRHEKDPKIVDPSSGRTHPSCILLSSRLSLSAVGFHHIRPP